MDARTAPGIPFAKGKDHRRFGGGRSPMPRVTLPDGKKRTLAELAREATYDSIQCLHQCVLDEGEERSTRCRAAGYLLTLGWGAAPKEATLRLVGSNEASSLSESELLALAMKLLPSPITVEQVAGDAAD